MRSSIIEDAESTQALLESYRRMVQALEQSCYLGVTRYGMLGRLAPVGSGQSEMLTQAGH